MGDDDSRPRESAARRRARRRRALDEAFGDVVPEVTRDEAEDTSADGRSPARQSADRDDQIRRDVPPHHT